LGSRVRHISTARGVEGNERSELGLRKALRHPPCLDDSPASVGEAHGGNPVPVYIAYCPEVRRCGEHIVSADGAHERLRIAAQSAYSASGEAVENQRRISLRLEPDRPIRGLRGYTATAVEEDARRMRPGATRREELTA